MATQVDLELHVYERVKAHQRNSETLSEALNRLIDDYEERRADGS
jgi:macrodomain Ter protein organizer (MatP/YcbG family)